MPPLHCLVVCYGFYTRRRGRLRDWACLSDGSSLQGGWSRSGSRWQSRKGQRASPDEAAFEREHPGESEGTTRCAIRRRVATNAPRVSAKRNSCQPAGALTGLCFGLLRAAEKARSNDGAPCGIRTHGPRIRNPVLYPSELRGRPRLRSYPHARRGPRVAISRRLALLY